MRKIINKSDFIILIALIIVAFAFSIGRKSENGKKAVIMVNGESIKEVSLEKDQKLSLDENEHIKFEVKDGKIRFTESDCPDKICVKTGFISLSGEKAVCLPNISGDVDISVR